MSGIFTDEWKNAKVSPIHDKDSTDDLNNYRPYIRRLFLLLRSFLKESSTTNYTIASRLIGSLLSNIQSGFRSHYSTLRC